MILVAPSILSADFSILGQEIKAVKKAGADWIHIDVMDGHFVPNITIGPVVVSKVRKISDLFFDVHLMITDPGKYIQPFADAGADLITIHAEAVKNHKELFKKIRKNGCKVGISINPETSFERIENLIEDVDLILIMSVHPGFGGQKFIENVLPKIKKARKVINASGKNILLEVDGGINKYTSKKVVECGANVLVAGNFIFTNPDYKKAIEILKSV
jgi:ribulose-phosphate 3-epimerase